MVHLVSGCTIFHMV